MDSGNNSALSASDRTRDGRVAVLMPYWRFWETSVPWDLRADREDLLAEATSVIEDVCSVEVSAMLMEDESVPSVLEALRDVDAIVLLATMAAPSATSMAVLNAVPETPIMVWALSRSADLSPNFSHTEITTAGSPVGAPMVTSALARAGRRFDVVATSISAPEAAKNAIRCAVTAGRLLRGPFLRVGDPIVGYTTVVPPTGSMSLLPSVAASSSELAELSAHAPANEVAVTVSEIRNQFDVDPNVSELSLERAARAEVGLRSMVQQTGAIAGTINCHEAALRGNPAFGVAPCLALGRLTTMGIPFTCTGDILTAFAMAAVRSLGYPTLYQEIEAFDFEGNEVVLANSGEHDLGLCGDRPSLVPSNWYLHDSVVGPCARYSVPEGPGSLVAFVMTPEPRFVVAEGAFTGHSFNATGVPNAGFRFGGARVQDAWADWARAGVTHHSVATNAHVGQELQRVARLIGTHFIQVS